MKLLAPLIQVMVESWYFSTLPRIVASSISVFIFCDTLTFSCFTIKIAKRNDSDPTDPEETLKSIQQEAKYSLFNKHVLEMCRKYNNTFRTVNMDNYHTSPAVLILI
jgi:hypothetical protein